MTPVHFPPSSLKEGRWYEYLIRFALGGGATVLTGLISSRYGAPHRRSLSSSSGHFLRERHADREA